MVVSNAALDRVTTLIKDDVTTCEMGTGDTNPNATDTDLETPVAATNLAPTTGTGNQSFSLTLTLNTGTGNGSTFTETGAFLNTSTLLNRNVFTGLAKTSSEEYNIITIFDVQSI